MTATGGYYINVASGTIQRQTNPLLAAALLAAGFIGPYATPAAAKAALPGGRDLSGDVTGAASKAASSAGSAASSAIIGFIKQGGIWERGAEIIIGILVLYIGLKAITTPQGATASTRTVKDTAKTIGSKLKEVAVAE